MVCAELLLLAPLGSLMTLIAPLHGISPLTNTEVIAPVVVLRLYVPMFGDEALETARQVEPNDGSLSLNARPIMFVAMADMFGRVPVKPRKVTDQGRVSLRMVSPPLLHAVRLAAVMAPTVPDFAIVLGTVPASVTSHSKVPLKVSVVHVALIDVDELESLPADAEAPIAPRSIMAARAARAS